MHKNIYEETLLSVKFSKAFDSIHKGKIKQILLEYGLCQEIVTILVMFSKDTKALVCPSDGDTNFCDIVTAVLQGDTLAPFLFIIYLGYIL